MSIGIVEVHACLQEIQDMLKKGYNIKMVYDALHGEGKIKIGKKRFYSLLQQLGFKKARTKYIPTVGDMYTRRKNKRTGTPDGEYKTQSTLPKSTEHNKGSVPVKEGDCKTEETTKKSSFVVKHLGEEYYEKKDKE